MADQGNSGVTQEQVLAVLSKVQEPELHQDLVTLNMIRDISIQGDVVNFTVMLTTPACPLKSQIEDETRAAVLAVPGVSSVNVKFDANVPSGQRMTGELDVPMRNIISVVSGKGGVGKTTVAVNLAASLTQMGAKVGILDADIYGPNVPIMTGLDELPPARDGKIVMPLAYGMQVMSMGFLVPPDQALVWRGPMLHKAIRQMFTDVAWDDLDYLIVDMPPGTGDAQLTLAQSVPVTGGVVVCTPQDVAWADAMRGVSALNSLQVPILGIVENMSYFVCPHCDEQTDIFSSGGGQRAAEKLGVPFLGGIPLHPDIRRGGDEGEPIVIRDPDSAHAQAFAEVARNLAARISVQNMASDPALKLV